jgi:hypothetical protein
VIFHSYVSLPEGSWVLFLFPTYPQVLLTKQKSKQHLQGFPRVVLRHYINSHVCHRIYQVSPHIPIFSECKMNQNLIFDGEQPCLNQVN